MSDDTIVFTRGVPANESFPLQRVAEAAAYAITEYGSGTTQYTKSYGFLPLREALAAEYNTTPDNILISNGSLQIVDFLGYVLMGQGSTIFTEAPSYDRTITLARRHHANVIGVPIEADGPNMDALETLLDQHNPTFLYLIADFQNPSGATISLKKRQQIIELSREKGFWILEDAPYRPLRYRGDQLPSLYELAPDRVLHMSSYTKQISPGVRVGYIVGDTQIIKPLAKIAEDTYITPNLIGEGIVYEFIKRGWLKEQLNELKDLYRPRLEAVCNAIRTHLPTAEWVEPDGGFFLSLTLPEGITSERLRNAAEDRGLVLSDGRGFFPIPEQGDRFIRLPFCALTEAELEEGIKRLAHAVNDVVPAPI